LNKLVAKFHTRIREDSSKFITFNILFCVTEWHLLYSAYKRCKLSKGKSSIRTDSETWQWAH